MRLHCDGIGLIHYLRVPRQRASAAIEVDVSAIAGGDGVIAPAKPW